MEAAWKDARAGVEQVNPDFLSVTQSQYAWNAYTDGYYFNVVRSAAGHQRARRLRRRRGRLSLSRLSRLEFGRMRDLRQAGLVSAHLVQHAPPTISAWSSTCRFMDGLQGMAKPPELRCLRPVQAAATAQGVVESQ